MHQMQQGLRQQTGPLQAHAGLCRRLRLADGQETTQVPLLQRESVQETENGEQQTHFRDTSHGNTAHCQQRAQAEDQKAEDEVQAETKKTQRW